jgi:uncharacterized protein YkwD
MSPSAEAHRVFRMFMHSPPHRANILRRGVFRHQGVGFVYRGDKLWVTHTFSGKRNPGMHLRTSAC